MKILSSLLFLLLSFSAATFAQSEEDAFFNSADQFFSKHVQDGLVDYVSIKVETAELEALVKSISQFDFSTKPANVRKAFFINAYNISAINAIIKAYPIGSPKDITSFFDTRTHIINGKKYSLNSIEKTLLFKEYKDARLHFVLVCVAKGCPPIISEAYRPEKIEAQLERQTKLAMNNPEFLKKESFPESVLVSEIFKWYANDFSPNVRSFINQYLAEPLESGTRIKFYSYNWSLNDQKPVGDGRVFERITTASMLPKGAIETKLFNSIYHSRNFNGFQNINSSSTFLSSFLQTTYGLGGVDVGIDFVYKSNRVNEAPNYSPFNAIVPRQESFEQTVSNVLEGNSSNNVINTSRSFGLAHIGAKVKFVPFKKVPDLTFQQTVFFPIQNRVDGAITLASQLFYNKTLTPKTQLFLEFTIWQGIGRSINPPFIKAFYSWFPTKQITLYATTTNLVEYGAGVKFLASPNLEFELLYTHYLPISELVQSQGLAQTFNVGIRYRRN